MSIRITMAMISKQYNNTLNRSLNNLNQSGDRVTTGRKYNKASQDPVSAVKAYKARRELTENENYTSNLNDVQGLMTTAESAIMQINSIAQQANSTDIIQSITDTMSNEDRSIVAKQINKLQESIVTIMNTRFSDRYIFGGSLSEEAPFSLDNNGNLLYRNINVNTGEHIGFAGTAAALNVSGTKIDFGQANGNAFNDYMINIIDGSDPYQLDTSAKTLTISLDISGGATNNDLQDIIRNAFTAAGIAGTDPSMITVDNLTSAVTMPGKGVVSGGENPIPAGTMADLDALAKEKVFIDMGLGLRTDSSGTIDEQSVFDISLPGISFLGYGTTNNGIPKNIYSLLGEISNQLKSSSYSFEKIQPYIEAFDKQYNNLLVGLTEFGTKSNFLDNIQQNLENNNLNITKRIDSIEYVDSADAIMDYKMQEYVYRAALQMGSQLLQPTLLDFMN